MKTFFGRRVAIFMGAATAVLMAGCGGGASSSSGGGGSTPPPPPPSVTVTVSPSTTTATIGTQVQFSATVGGTNVTDNTVKWSVSGPSGSTDSAGSIDANGLYTTPYPAPATVTITATSNQDSTVSGSATVTLAAPAAGTGPALSVDVSKQTHAINPYIYGMNGWGMPQSTGSAARITVDRFGGDASSRYNYQLNVTSSAADWYFENQNEVTNGVGQFDAEVASDKTIGARTLGTLPVNGWVAKDATSCSFPTSTYPGQAKVDSGRGCGNGVYPQGTQGCTNANGCNITGNDPTVTSTAINGAAWATQWVTYLVGKFGTAANGGVAIYDLDNEPSWWDAVHRDVHPKPFTYDEVTNNGLAVAKAVKAADPTAEVSGPVMDYWWDYFYSKKDVEDGWGTGPCFAPWQNPTDRTAHGGVPFIEYYLQQFKAAQASDANNTRFLDYLDLHTYFAPQYPLNSGNGIGLTTAGDTAEQEERLDSTRVFWDPTYTDPDTKNQPFPQPNYVTDSNYTTSCNVPAMAPQIIRLAKQWIANDYPGTKLAITEYNWGGQETINGALAQADILGIFGREGLDLGTLWGAPDPTKGQTPGLMAFEVYRNYDGNKSTFGDMSIESTSVDQGKLAVYGGLRTSDNKVTLVVINKTYGDLSSTLTVNNLSAATTSAQAFLYSNANINAIVAQPNVTVNPPTGSGTASTLTTTFPAQSITLLVMQN
ncbi:MAG: glycoside hydrolase family 44 protein [Acidobacteriota bacterium]